jgi:hypothetical protein
MALLARKPESPTIYSSMLWVFHVNTGRRLTACNSNQFFLVLLVIGSVATEIYVMVINCLVDWRGGNVRLLAMHAFYTCCMSGLCKPFIELWI